MVEETEAFVKEREAGGYHIYPKNTYSHDPYRSAYAIRDGEKVWKEKIHV